MKFIEKSGKTTEDAVRAGLAELGCDMSDVDIEVLDAGSPGLFGLFGRLAQVRITVKEEEKDFDLEMPTLSLNPEKKQKKTEEKKAAPKAEEKKPEPKVVIEEETAPKAEEEAAPEEAPEAEEKPRKERQKRESKPRAPKPQTEEAPFVPTTYEDLPECDPESLSELGKKCYDFLKTVTEKMGVAVEIRVQEEEGLLRVQMIGDTLGILIGRRGETLDALQYLTSLHVNRDKSDYTRVTIDTEHYRAKREEALVKLAQRMAAKAKKTGRRVALEPMNPYERRILHSALQNDRYVTTHSEGEEPYRRVIITLK